MVNKIAVVTPAAAAKSPAQAAAKIAAHAVSARSTDQGVEKVAATPAAAKPLAEAVEKITATAAVAATEPVAQAAEKIAAVTTLPLPMRRVPQNTGDELFAACRATLASVGESQRAVATGVKALALEITGMAQASLTEAADSATALIRARNFADAVEIQFGFARRSFAALIAGSTRLSEIGTTLMSEISRPIVAPTHGLPRR
jgi:hypothetical protein